MSDVQDILGMAPQAAKLSVAEVRHPFVLPALSPLKERRLGLFSVV